MWWHMLWPLLLIIISNILYNIATKSTPGNINPFASLVITYLIAALASFLLFLGTATNKNIFLEATKINWTSIVLGFSIVILEVAYIYLYRAGWKISTASLTANVALACALLFIGTLFYKEYITIQQILGLAICIGGLYLIGR